MGKKNFLWNTRSPGFSRCCAVLFSPSLRRHPAPGQDLSARGLWYTGRIMSCSCQQDSSSLLPVLLSRGIAKNRNWYNTHKLLEIAGGACIIAGLVVGISMVTLSGLPHLRNIHEIFGVTTGLLVIVAIALGIFIRRAHTSKNAIRVSHRWLGWILTGLMVITIIFGLLFLSALLYR